MLRCILFMILLYFVSTQISAQSAPVIDQGTESVKQSKEPVLTPLENALKEVEKFKVTLDADPQDSYAKRQLAEAYFNLAGIHTESQELRKATIPYTKYVELMQQLYNQDTSNWRYKHSFEIGYQLLATLYQKIGDDKEALSVYKKHIILAEGFYTNATIKDTWAYALRNSYHNSSAISERLGDILPAYQFAQKEIEMAKLLFDNSPNDNGYQTNLIYAYNNTAYLANKLNQTSQAALYLKQRDTVLERIRANEIIAADKRLAEDAAKNKFGAGATGGIGNSGGNESNDPNSRVLADMGKLPKMLRVAGFGGRPVTKVPKLEKYASKKGRIVLSVCVEVDGNVSSANFKAAGSDSNDADLVKEAVNHATQIKFAPNATEKQCGTISYNFIVEE